MRASRTRNGRTVVAVSGKHGAALALSWPKNELDGLLGFAIERTDPDGKRSWLQTALRFEGEPIEKGKLYNSSEAPIQSFIWSDFGLNNDKTSEGLPAGSRLIYEVTPVRGKPGALVLESDAAIRISISTEPEHDHGPDEPEVHFNRGLSQMQEYERLFGSGHNPRGDVEALAWLSQGLDRAKIAFVNQANEDPTLLLDVAAYHLDHPGLLEALEKLGKRLRISLDWGKEEVTTPPNKGPNGPAYERLVAAGATVHQREHINISHNKFMVLKAADGTPKSVLTGSTNFTSGGISNQSNQSVIVHNEAVGRAYVACFELVLKNDNEGLRNANKKGTTISDILEIYFSPHHPGDRPDLERLTALAKAAKTSRLFMTFRMTDHELISAMLGDNVPVFGVADRVYQGKDDSGDRLIYTEAYTADPRVVACNETLDEELDEDALYKELKRDGYEPLIHHKILLLDWATPDCVVVTGSANYSMNSTAGNDENSLIVRGDQRLAEEYFVELCRLYTHWRSRWLRGRDRKTKPSGAEVLFQDSKWTGVWTQGGRLGSLLDVAITGADADAETDADVVPIAPARPASDAEPAKQAASLGVTPAGKRIEHVIVLMLENRSFDQMLGLLPGVDGITLGADGKDAAHVNYADPQKPTPDGAYYAQKAQYFSIPEGDIPTPKNDEKNHRWDMYGGPSHSFPAASQQVYNDSWGPTGKGSKDTTPATQSGFVKGYINELQRTYTSWAKADPTYKAPDSPPRDHVAAVMGSFSPEQLPVLNGLAKEFCVCDHWFSEVPGPTEPNRLFIHAATSVGLIHNPWELPIEARTIYEDIDEAGRRDWAFYAFDLSDALNFPALKKQTGRLRPFSQFAADLQKPSTFPSYVFLCPRYWSSEEGFANSQHAPYDVRYGEHWIADVYEALRNSPLWESTLLIITYDEHGGFYDHIVPPDQAISAPDAHTSPTASDRKSYGYMFYPDGGAKSEYVFDFNRLGCRVPAVLVSPWIAKGKVESKRLQHTSVIATVRKMWGLRPQPLTAREAQAGTFDELLEELGQPRQDCPTKLERPPLPDVSLQAAADQPLSPAQREIFEQVTHLDGHVDSGQLAPAPKTQGEAAKYIRERTDAHQAFHEASPEVGKYTIYKDKRGEYRWRLQDGKGQTVASSGEGFSSADDAKSEIARVQSVAATAVISES